MKRILKNIITSGILIAIIVMISNNCFAVTDYVNDGKIQATISSSVENGGNVIQGDNLTYIIKLKNNTNNMYYGPELIIPIPDGTEYIDGTASGGLIEGYIPAIYDSVQNYVDISQVYFPAGSELTYTVTVKVKDGYNGNIVFANGNSKIDGEGIVCTLYNEKYLAETEEEYYAYFEDVKKTLLNSNTTAEKQANLQGKAYYNRFPLQQTHKAVAKSSSAAEVKQEETKQEETKQEEAKQEEVKQEETKQEETKQEEAKQEETKQEEAKPVVKENKPTQLPKTGNEANIFTIAFGILMIMVGSILIIKK